MTCSRASVNSRLSRRTSFAWRCSSVVEPYIDDPPDISEIWLPWADTNKIISVIQWQSFKLQFTFVILLLINKPVVRKRWRKKPREATWRWWCWLTPGYRSAYWQAIIRLSFNVRPTTQHWRIHFLRLSWSRKWAKQLKLEAIKHSRESFNQRALKVY